MRRSSSQGAGQLLRAIVADDDQPVTVHDIAMAGAAESLPARVRGARERRAAAMRYRTTNYERWRAAADTFAIAMSEPRGRDLGLSRSIAHGSIYSQAGVWRASEQRWTSVHATTARCAPSSRRDAAEHLRHAGAAYSSA